MSPPPLPNIVPPTPYRDRDPPVRLNMGLVTCNNFLVKHLAFYLWSTGFVGLAMKAATFSVSKADSLFCVMISFGFPVSLGKMDLSK